MKTCRVCHQTKLLSEFYRSRSECRACQRAYAAKYRKTAKCRNTKKRYQQYYKESGKTLIAYRRYRQTEKSKNTKKRYRANHPERYQARIAVSHAIRDGKIPKAKKLKCHYCPAQAEQYHHPNGYEPKHWLDVVPACRKCHDIKNRKIA